MAKKEPVRLIVDLNAVLNSALLGGKDPDGETVTDEDGKSHHVNTALYGVERFFDYLAADMERFAVAPKDVIGVWDGLRAKQYRQVHLPQYKVGREKLPQAHAQLGLARDMLAPMLRHLGFTTCATQGREADDVIAYLVRELRDRPNIVSTVDGDLSVLVDANTHVWRGGKLNENPYGQFPHRHISLYKALVGDPSDKIPGAKGFGDAAWVDLIRVFGVEALDYLTDLINEGQIKKLAEDVAELPKLAKIIESEAMVTTCWRVARLHPEDANTQSHPLEITAGMVRPYNDLPETERVEHKAFRKWYGTKTLVTAGNYDKAKTSLKTWMPMTQFVALDIETSSGEESDAWLDTLGDTGSKVDTLGSKLTGMSLTFGDNCQHTIYMSVDHAMTDNITVDQCREMVEQVPQTIPLVVHNGAFEGPVLHRTWGDKWKDNGWHGFLPNALDTAIGATYVDENLGRGLKLRSKVHLGYEQQTYEDVTTMEGPLDVIPPGGLVKKGPFSKVIEEAVLEDYQAEVIDEDTGELCFETRQREVEPAIVEENWYVKQYKMKELTGRRVLNYGCDDTICTAALHNYFSLVMKLEHTWEVYLSVEQKPMYLTNLAYLKGVRLSLPRLMELEKEDDEVFKHNWKILREFLFEQGWAGTRKPVYEEITAAAVKEVCEIVVGEEFTTRKKKLPAVAGDLREAFPDNDVALTLAAVVESNSLESFNALVDKSFTGEPKINFNSPRQIQKLLYGSLGMTPRIYNKLTEKERSNEEMREAFNALRRINDGKTVAIKEEWRAHWMKKASTDDQAIDLALAKDELTDAQRQAMVAYLRIKEVSTRRQMFYGPYKKVAHWSDGRIHPYFNQCATVTKRYSSSGPNLQQLPSSSGFRGVLLAHHKDAVVVSLDFNAQEIRATAHASQDKALISCYVGENKFDVHSLVAVRAAPYVWGQEVTYEEFVRMRKAGTPEEKARAEALRKGAKATLFGTVYGIAAPKLALQLKTDEDTAQKFLDALDEAFPGVNIWKEKTTAEAHAKGYSTTFLGDRRHLSTGLRSSNRGEESRAERQACNAVIQGSSAAQVKLAMSRMWDSDIFTSGKYDAEFIATIHDECVASVHKSQVVEFVRDMHKCMTEKFADMGIPAVSSIALGRDFTCPIEVGEDVDEGAILKAVEELFEGDV